MKKACLLLITLFLFSIYSFAGKIIIYKCGAQPGGKCATPILAGDCRNFTPTDIVLECIDVTSIPNYGGGVKIASTAALAVVVYGNGDVFYERLEAEDSYYLFNIYNCLAESEEYVVSVGATEFIPNDEVYITVSKIEYKEDAEEPEEVFTESDAVTDVIDLSSTLYEFALSPNPVSSNVIVSNQAFSLTDEAVDVVLYDLSMENNWDYLNLKESNYAFNVESLNDGMYIYVLYLNEEVKSSGLIQVEH